APGHSGGVEHRAVDILGPLDGLAGGLQIPLDAGLGKPAETRFASNLGGTGDVVGGGTDPGGSLGGGARLGGTTNLAERAQLGSRTGADGDVADVLGNHRSEATISVLLAQRARAELITAQQVGPLVTEWIGGAVGLAQRYDVEGADTGT